MANIDFQQQQMMNQVDIWDKIAAIAFTSPFPVGIFAGLGYLAQQLLKVGNDEKLDKRNLVGGVMLATFTGFAMFLLLKSTGMHGDLATAFAFAIGASGDKGFLMLLERAKKQR